MDETRVPSEVSPGRVDDFLRMRTAQDLADVLGISYSRLVYHLYKVPDEEKYTVFHIPKGRSGLREIKAPVSALKLIQMQLAELLQCVYSPKPCVHGFVPKRDILTNAIRHKRKRYVLNIDLERFFPSINFGRVWGMFQAQPFRFRKELATVLAQICCSDGTLPQGAPTSPVVSNIICYSLDRGLQALAKKHHCHYTRYADDITFSTRRNPFPEALASVNVHGASQVGRELAETIEAEGFQINNAKVRLQHRLQHQEVTGLTVNRIVNVDRRLVRQVRAMIHAWQKFGLEAAEREYHARYCRTITKPGADLPDFRRVVLGKLEHIGHIKGKRDPVYLGLLTRLAEADPQLGPCLLPPPSAGDLAAPLLMTEGKSDWRHIDAALRDFQGRGQYEDLDIEIRRSDDDMGAPDLLAFCKRFSRVKEITYPVVAVFDHDRPEVIKEHEGHENEVRDWGNDVFSLLLPVPAHRSDLKQTCTELYYTNSELRTKDRTGRRLYLNSEFSGTSGVHKEDPGLVCRALNLVRRHELTVIDSDVYRTSDDSSAALSKAMFAENVYNEVAPFSDVSFGAFDVLFDRIAGILRRMREAQAQM